MRALFGQHFDGQTQCLRNHQNVRKNNGSVQKSGIPIDGLERYFAGELGSPANSEKVGFGPRLAKFLTTCGLNIAIIGCFAAMRTWEVPARLTHDPDRNFGHALAFGRLKDQIVLEWREVRIR